MSNGIKRSIKTAQVNLREINLKVLGTAATPKCEGLDEYGVKSVTDSGTGLLTIIFKNPFLSNEVHVKSIAMITDDADAHVVAVAYDRVTIQARVGGANADADYYLTVLGSDFKNKV